MGKGMGVYFPALTHLLPRARNARLAARGNTHVPHIPQDDARSWAES